MTLYPTPEALAAYAREGYLSCPVCGVLPADLLTPIEALRRLQAAGTGVFLAEGDGGRFITLGCGVQSVFRVKNGRVRVDGKRRREDAETALAEWLSSYRAPSVPGMPPFAGGAVGYFGAGFALPERPARDDEDLDDARLAVFGSLAVFDTLGGKLFLIARAALDAPDCGMAGAAAEIEALAQTLSAGEKPQPTPFSLLGAPRPMERDDVFASLAEESAARLGRGAADCLSLSYRLSSPFAGSLTGAYRLFRLRAPGNVCFFWDEGGTSFAAAAADADFRFSDGVLRAVTATPLAGGAPTAEERRGHTLLAERAGETLFRLCEPGSVDAGEWFEVRRRGMQTALVSLRSGKPPKESGAPALLRPLLASMDGGVPFAAARAVAAATETHRRGLSGGAFGYLSFAGALALFAPREGLLLRSGTLFARAGAPLLAGGDPSEAAQSAKTRAGELMELVALAGEEKL